MRKLFWLILAAVLLAMPGIASADDDCVRLITEARNSQDPARAIRAVLDFRLTPACVIEILLIRKHAHVLNTILIDGYRDATQALQQNGSSTGSGGTTNLVSKNLTSKVLSLASEYGALTQSSSGQTTTFSGTLDGIPIALEAHSDGLVTECPLNLMHRKCLNSGFLNVLGRISYSVAFNTSQSTQLTGMANGPVQGSSQPVSVTSNGTTAVGQITAKYVIFQPAVAFDQVTKALNGLGSGNPVDSASTELSTATNVLKAYQANAGQDQDPPGAWDNWVTTTASKLSSTPSKEVVTEWEKQGDGLAAVLENNGAQTARPTDDELTQAALNYASAYAKLESAERSFYESSAITPTPVLSFEYDENRPASQPTNSVFRLIYGQPLGKNWTLAGNAAVSIYDQTPSSSIPGAQRLRDIQLAFEADYTLGKLGILGTPIVSGAYYFQDQTSPAILNVIPGSPVPGITFVGLSANATQAFATKGKISIGQLRISLGNSQSGLRVPLAITFSNRTELTTGFKVGAQIGISYNFDSLFGK